MFISPSIWQGWNFPKVVSPEHFLSAGLRIISNLHSALTLLTPQRRREKALDDYIAPLVPSPLHLKKVLLKRFPKECTSNHILGGIITSGETFHPLEQIQK